MPYGLILINLSTTVLAERESINNINCDDSNILVAITKTITKMIASS